MTLLLNEEQAMLRDSAQAFLAQRAPVSAQRALRDRHDPLGYEPALWREVAEMGWPAAAMPEAHGGLGAGYKGLAAVFEQMGRSLAATPLLASAVLGAGLIQELGSPVQQAQWLPRIAAGEMLLALALEERPRHQPSAVALSAVRKEGSWLLDGTKAFVLDGHVAEHLLVVARTAGQPGAEQGLSVFMLPATTPGLRVERTRLVDSRNAATVHFNAVQVDVDALLGEASQAWSALDRVLDHARLCLAAESLGLITEAFERTVAYLKERVQFGVPIGSFQALQHRVARLHVELELLRSCVAAAAQALDAGDAAAAPLRVSLAKARAADLSERALNEAVQLHGGIGVTDELDIGLFLKRARVLQQTFGDGVFHRDRFARLSGF